MAGFTDGDILTAANLNPSTGWERIAVLNPGSAVGSVAFGYANSPNIPTGSNYKMFKVLVNYFGSPAAGANNFFSAQVNGNGEGGGTNYGGTRRVDNTFSTDTNQSNWYIVTTTESGAMLELTIPRDGIGSPFGFDNSMLCLHAIGTSIPAAGGTPKYGNMIESSYAVNLTQPIFSGILMGIGKDAIWTGSMMSGASFILLGTK